MKLIKSVVIEKFRSIKSAKLDDLGNLSALVGLNNSGKSNFLRGLNLFFKGELEPNQPFDFERDHYRSEPQSKRKKAIRINVEFELPSNFKFRKNLESCETLLGRKFTITKEWTTQNKKTPEYYLNGSTTVLTQNDIETVNLFLGLIRFRYIPNRVIPTDIIASEQQSFSKLLNSKLARFKGKDKALFKTLKKITSALVEQLSSEVTRVVPGITAVRLATPQTLADLAFALGFLVKENVAKNATEMSDVEQGSGVQSLLMIKLLGLIDTDISQQYGWRQAVIWAFEEPESSLHVELEAQIANLLAKAARKDNGRLQIIATTHSELITAYSDKGYLIDKKSASKTKLLGTVVESHHPEELVKITPKLGISKLVSPLLRYPTRTIIITEGKTDKEFLAECLRLLNSENDCILFYPGEITNNLKSGGKEELKKAIEQSIDAIRSRPASAPPVFALFDWEENKAADILRKSFKKDPVSVLKWDETKANPTLSESFKGIERFYPDRIIAEAEKKYPGTLSTYPGGARAIGKQDYDKRFKPYLNEIIKKGLFKEDLKFVKDFINTYFLN